MPASRFARVVRGVDALERRRLALGVQRLARAGPRPPRSGARAARRPHELDRHVEQALEPLLDELAARSSGSSASRDRRGRPRSASRQRPIAARRRPYGSREPVGLWPSENATVRVSTLSAAASTLPASVCGSGPPAAVRQVLLLDRRAHRLGVAGEPRVLGADVALEVRELAHELGGLVGLREPRRLARRVAAAELPDELRAAVGLVRNVPAPAKNVIAPSRSASRVDAELRRRART